MSPQVRCEGSPTNKAQVAKLENAPASKPGSARSVGSSPTLGTNELEQPKGDGYHIDRTRDGKNNWDQNDPSVK